MIPEADTEVQKNIQPLLPYLFHVRGRFHGFCIFHREADSWMITNELERYTKPFEKVIPLLLENGNSGYISSEYEGSRYAQVASSHLGLQQKGLKRMLAEI